MTYVKSEKEAEQTIVELFTQYASETAWDNFVNEARAQKRSPEVVLQRTVRNFLRSGRLRRTY